jgi:UDP-N-acetylmuramyl tripeptide synthase
VKFSDLIKAVKPLWVDPKGAPKSTDPEIKSVHYRAQEVEPGGLFFAIAGHAADGHDFIKAAIKKGAVAIVSQKELRSEIPNIQVADTRQTLADIAAWFYGRPSELPQLIWWKASCSRPDAALVLSEPSITAMRVSALTTR